MARKSRRARTRTRTRTRTVYRRPGARTSTSTTAISSRSGDGWGKYVLPAVAVGIVAYLLWPKTASAAGRDGRDGNGKDKDGRDVRPPPPPGPRPFPAGSKLAVISVATGEQGMNIRAQATPTSALVGSVPNGSTIAVLTAEGDLPESGLPDTPGKNRWVYIQTAQGVKGYLRSIGPNGESNIRVTGGPDTGMLYPAFRPYQGHFAHGGQLQQHGVVPAPGWRPAAWRGW